MITSNGYKALLQGSVATMVREGLWSTVYLTAAPVLTAYLQQRGMQKNAAEGTSLVVTAGSFGFFTTPLNQLRSRKQKGLTEPVKVKNYAEHLVDIWNQKPTASPMQRLGFLFKGGGARTITTTAGGALIVKGNELYVDLTQTAKPGA